MPALDFLVLRVAIKEAERTKKGVTPVFLAAVALRALVRVHTPGIEPGPAAWKAVVLPLHHVCSVTGDGRSRADYILCSSQNSVLRVRYLGLVLAGPSEAPSRRSTHLHLSLETEVIDPSQVTVQCACHKGFEQCGPVQYHCTDRSEDDFFSARVTFNYHHYHHYHTTTQTPTQKPIQTRPINQ